jgi:hypothetical protein
MVRWSARGVPRTPWRRLMTSRLITRALRVVIFVMENINFFGCLRTGVFIPNFVSTTTQTRLQSAWSHQPQLHPILRDRAFPGFINNITHCSQLCTILATVAPTSSAPSTTSQSLHIQFQPNSSNRVALARFTRPSTHQIL